MIMKKKVIAIVTALILTATTGTWENSYADAATCPPHGTCVERFEAASYPQTSSHRVLKYNQETNDYDYVGDCTYTYQYITMALVCTVCNCRVASYEYCSEVQSKPICEEYGQNY